MLEIVPGPDFPTGGFILGRQGILDAYTKGRGQLKLRAKAAIERMGKDREQIIVTEIPYQVNKSQAASSRSPPLVNEKKHRRHLRHAATKATATACASSSS